MSNVVIRVYMTDKPRVLGLFHTGSTRVDVPNFKARAGAIMHMGPCKCGDPSHRYPTYYSLTPTLFVRYGVKMFTVRIPWVLFDAIQWFKGSL